MILIRRLHRATLFPYTTLFRSHGRRVRVGEWILPAAVIGAALVLQANLLRWLGPAGDLNALDIFDMDWRALVTLLWASRSEEHTSELQSQFHLVCRLLLEKKNS